MQYAVLDNNESNLFQYVEEIMRLHNEIRSDTSIVSIPKAVTTVLVDYMNFIRSEKVHYSLHLSKYKL